VDSIVEEADRARRIRYQLNFPYRIQLTPGGALPKLVLKKFYPHFEPGETNRFTIDTAGRLRLTDIRAVKIVMGPVPDAFDIQSTR
jgi:hypothetical protein